MKNAIDNNNILFGATGKTGEQICKELISHKVKLSVFVREESANKLKGNDMNIIHGDVLNYGDVEAAIKGDSYTDVIISLGVGDSWNQLGGFGKLISNLLLKSVLQDHQKQGGHQRHLPKEVILCIPSSTSALLGTQSILQKSWLLN
jgi:NAD(P)H-binding